MARVYDVISRLENGNKKPIVKVDSEHEFKINNSKSAAFRIMAISEDKKIKDDKRVEDIIKVSLGKDAFEYIEGLELSMMSYNTIINVIMAAISDIDLEEMEEISKKEAEKFRK